MKLDADLRDLFYKRQWEFFPTGSAYICSPPVEDTDEDWFVCINERSNRSIADAVYDLSSLGFTYNENEHYQTLIDSQFLSLRRDYINIILTANKNFSNSWLLATEHAKSLNLLKKEDRIKLFRHYLYGEDLNL